MTEYSKTSIKKIIGDYYYYLDNKIGSGMYSNVYKAQHIHSHEVVAIKQINFAQIKNDQGYLLIDNEICTMKRLDQENVIELIDTFMTQNSIYLIQEYCNEKTLGNLIEKGKIPQEKALKYFRDIALGMYHCYKKGVMHRDLKPDNILITDGVCKLGDFGFSTDNYKSHSQFLGTPLYMSPQVLSGQKYTHKTDVWSMGVMLYEMLTTKTPWVADNLDELKRNIQRKSVFFPNYVNKDVKDLILKCLKADETDRICFSEILKHKALNKRNIIDNNTRTPNQPIFDKLGNSTERIQKGIYNQESYEKSRSPNYHRQSASKHKNQFKTVQKKLFKYGSY